jgi:hypothetical protein
MFLVTKVRSMLYNCLLRGITGIKPIQILFHHRYHSLCIHFFPYKSMTCTYLREARCIANENRFPKLHRLYHRQTKALSHTWEKIRRTILEKPYSLAGAPSLVICAPGSNKEVWIPQNSVPAKGIAASDFTSAAELSAMTRQQQYDLITAEYVKKSLKVSFKLFSLI